MLSPKEIKIDLEDNQTTLRKDKYNPEFKEKGRFSLHEI
jgi:hypothetical protein